MSVHQEAGRGEHWWPVRLVIATAAVLHVALPAKCRVNPPLITPVWCLCCLTPTRRRSVRVAAAAQADRARPL